MSLTLLLEHSLELVAERIGDPAPRVFERLFLEAPDLLALVSNDASGSVRGEMFLRALECLQDAAGAGRFATGLVAAEHLSHQVYGVTTAQFERFFEIIVAVFRDALGADWTPDIDAAWQVALQRLRVGAAA